MPCISAEWFSAVSNGVMALAAVGAVGYAGRELELRRRERREDSRDVTARDILEKGDRARSETTSALMRMENAVSTHLNSGRTVFDRHDQNPYPLDELNGADQAYQEFSGALFMGRAIWGDRFAEEERRIRESHFSLLLWAMSAHSLCVLPPAEDDSTPEAKDARFKKFNETLSEFHTAIDDLARELSGFLHGSDGREDRC